MDPYGMVIDITTDGEYAQHGEVKIVMTTEQVRSIVERLKVVGDDGTAENWAAIDALVEAYAKVEARITN